MANFNISKPTAYPISAPPGPVLINVPIYSYIAGYATVRVMIYEGSWWVTHGDLLETLEVTVYFNVGQTTTAQVMHQSTLGTIDRRDVRVIIYDEFTSPENPITDKEWDDIFFVTQPADGDGNGGNGGGGANFSGLITKVTPIQFTVGSLIQLSIDFNAYALNTIDFAGWETRLTATFNGLSDYDRQNHIGQDGSRTGQTLTLGAMPAYNLAGTITLEAKGLLGQWELLNAKNFNITAIGVPPDGDGIPPLCTVDADCPSGYVCENGQCVKVPSAEGTDWTPILLIGGGALLLATALRKSKKGTKRSRK